MTLVLDIALKVLLFAGLIGGICAAVFMWLNNSDSERDQESYDEDFDARDKISDQFVHKVQPEEEAELYQYVEQLKAYEMPSKVVKAAPQVQVRVRAPANAGKRMYATMGQPVDVVDAEVVAAASCGPETEQAEHKNDDEKIV